MNGFHRNHRRIQLAHAGDMQKLRLARFAPVLAAQRAESNLSVARLAERPLKRNNAIRNLTFSNSCAIDKHLNLCKARRDDHKAHVFARLHSRLIHRKGQFARFNQQNVHGI